MSADGNRNDEQGRGDGAAAAALQASLRLYNHDIRAAVSDVIGGLRLIDRERLNADMQDQLARVQIAGETLAELVDAAILSLDGEAQDTTTDHSFEFRGFLAGLEMRWSGRAREQGLGFHLDVDRRAPESVGIARIKLDRILGNLIANALKFTDHGTVKLRVDLAGDALRFSVTDQGQGFSDAALERLFTPEGRPQDATRPGTGLGLHISKDLANSLGADLSVTSAAGQGATATLIVPRDRWEPTAQPRELPDLTGLTVLVAEDNVTNQILVRQMLEQMGARMTLACDGAEAFEALGARRYDLALLDIEMPRMTGIEVMRKIRERGDVDTPLVALTAYILRDNREAIYAAGADGVIAKPIRSVAGFGQAILRHVERSTLAANATLITPEDGSRSIGELDDNRFEALLQAAGPEGRVEFLTHLLQDLRSVSRLLARAESDSDADEVRAQTHILISLAGAVGADRLQELAESLNATAHRGRLAEAPVLAATCLQALDVLIDRVEKRGNREG